MRQKLSLILAAVGVIAGGISYLVVPPARYDSNQNRIIGVQKYSTFFDHMGFGGHSYVAP